MSKKSLKSKFDDFKSQVNSLIYAGKNVECSICNHQFREFKTFGWKRKKSPKCINCGSRARHRLIWKYLTEKTNLLENHVKVLHFAPERAFYDRLSKYKNIEYYTCDLYPEKYDFIPVEKRLKVDITNIPLKDNEFDIILCNHVLEHIPDDNMAMKELYRIMKVGGFGIFQVPIQHDRESTYEDFSITDPKEREKAFGQFDHVRLYGNDYKERLKAVGFNVVLEDYVNTFSDNEQKRYGFDSSEIIYRCEKQ